MSDTERLLQIKRLKETRQRLSQQRLNAAILAEEVRHRAALDATQAYVDKHDATKNYVADRFKETNLSKSPEASFTSFALGHYAIRQEVSSLRLKSVKVRSLFDQAQEAREQVAKEHLVIMQKTKLFCEFVDNTIRQVRATDDDRADDEMMETFPRRTTRD